MSSSSKVFTLEEVAKHSSKEDCWLVIGGKFLCGNPCDLQFQSSSNEAPPPVAPSISETMEMVRKCGVQEGTELFFSSSILFMKPEYRELFASLQTKNGRYDWLKRASMERQLKNL